MESCPNVHLRGFLLFNEGKSPRRYPPTADVLSAEVHRSNLGSTVAGGQMPTRRCYE